jgi:predicted Fe-Mo cluster-binding NifX family protein
MKAINAAMKEKASLATADMRTKVRNVQANLTILTRDGSRGAHNFSSAQKIMAQAGKDLEEVKTALK